MTNYRDHGVPAELFESTKRRLIADQELSRNSISSLASDWADTIAVDREPSIAYEQELIGRVTLADVNRVAKRYLDVNHAVIGALTPSAAHRNRAAPAPAGLSRENPLGKEPTVTHLPDWGNALVHDVAVPNTGLAPVQAKLANGITLIVQPETISDTVFVYGIVKTAPQLEEPLGQEGVSRILEGVYPVRHAHAGSRIVSALARCNRYRARAAAVRSACRRRRAASTAPYRCWRRTNCSRAWIKRRSTSSNAARSISCKPNSTARTALPCSKPR